MGASQQNLKARAQNRWVRARKRPCWRPRNGFTFAWMRSPPGVISYGALAAQAGVPRGARWAGRVLRHLPTDSTLPWYRVLRGDGTLGLTGAAGARQRDALVQEGHRLESTTRGWRLARPIPWSPYR